MTPYYQDGLVTIYNADCRDVLASARASTVMLTDPPYNEVDANDDTGGLRILKKGEADKAFVDPGWLAVEAVRVVSGSIYIFCGLEQFSVYAASFRRQGLTVRAGVWEKTNPSPMNGERLWLSGVELCVFARNAGATFNPRCKTAVWRGPTEPDEEHPTAKPVWLMSQLIAASTKNGDTVVDPFCGIGSTLVAAKLNGCKSVGIEINERHCEVAANRCRQGSLSAMFQ